MSTNARNILYSKIPRPAPPRRQTARPPARPPRAGLVRPYTGIWLRAPTFLCIRFSFSLSLSLPLSLSLSLSHSLPRLSLPSLPLLLHPSSLPPSLSLSLSFSCPLSRFFLFSFLFYFFFLFLYEKISTEEIVRGTQTPLTPEKPAGNPTE